MLRTGRRNVYCRSQSVLNKLQYILFPFNPVPSTFQRVLGPLWAVSVQFSLRHVRSNQFMVSLARLHCVLRQPLTRAKLASGCVAVRSTINSTTFSPVYISIEVGLLHESTCQKWGDPRSKRDNVEELRSAVFSRSLTQHVLILLILLSYSCFYYSRCSLISLYCCSSNIIYR